MLAASCGEAVPRLTSGPDAATELGLTGPDGFRHRCESFPFDAAILLEPGDAELGTSPAAAALRKYLATPPAKREGLPESGWHGVGDDGAFAEFVTAVQEGGAVVVHSVQVTDGWRVSSSSGCRPELVLPAGVGQGSWELDRDASEPGRETRVLRILVQEWTCSSGRPPLGRIVGPVVFGEPARIYIVFGVRPIPGAQTCQRSPSSLVEIDLGEAMGARSLVDPSRWPNVTIDIAP